MSATSTAALTDWDLDLNLGCMIILACLRVPVGGTVECGRATTATVK